MSCLHNKQYLKIINFLKKIQENMRCGKLSVYYKTTAHFVNKIFKCKRQD